MIVYPIVHLNGTSRGRLLDELTGAADAIRHAITSHREASPNARDYYLDEGRFPRAVRAHQAREQKLLGVLAELQALAQFVATGEETDGCGHESVLAPDGHGAYCRHCGEATA